jgi:oxygen-dependent protoporphyrinogen oxidase
MNGAEPEECYMGNFGTNIRTAFDKYEQLSVGLNNILDSFSKGIDIKLNTQVQNIEYAGDKVKLTLKSNGKKVFSEYDRVIIATPAYITKDLIKGISSKASKALRNINYFPVGVIVAEYQEDVFNSEIRAMVFDKDQPISNIGAYGINDLNVVRYTFSGKVFRDEFGKKLTPERAIKLAERLVPNEFNIKGNKRVNYIYNYWDKGLCAYSPCHHKNLQLINSELEKNKKISLAGDYIKGASIEACFSSSKEAVGKLL